MRRFLTSTAGGKAGTIDGLNLFFGALLGANLGSLGRMNLIVYVELVVLLGGLVMALRMLSTSPRRRMMLVTIGIYVLLLASTLFVPGLQPRGMDPVDHHRLLATLAIWIVFAVAAELSPMESTTEAD